MVNSETRTFSLFTERNIINNYQKFRYSNGKAYANHAVSRDLRTLVYFDMLNASILVYRRTSITSCQYDIFFSSLSLIKEYKTTRQMMIKSRALFTLDGTDVFVIFDKQIHSGVYKNMTLYVSTMNEVANNEKNEFLFDFRWIDTGIWAYVYTYVCVAPLLLTQCLHSTIFQIEFQ